MDPTLIDRGNLIEGDWATYSRYDAQNYHCGEMIAKLKLFPFELIFASYWLIWRRK